MVGSVFGGSGTPTPPTLSTYQYPNLSSDASSFNTLLGQNINNNPSSTYAGQASNIYQNMINDPNAAGYTGAATAAGTQAANLAGLNGSNATAASNAGNSLIGSASTVANMGLDPQSALYNRTLQQLQQQSAVTNAQNGLSMSPYGADLTNEAVGNFDINWNAQQLNNAIAGLNSASSADTAGAGLLSDANALGGAGVNSTLASGAVPYTASQAVGGNNATSLNSLISTLTGANTTNQMSLQDILSYLQGGSNQSNAQAQLTQQNYQNQVSAANQANQGLASLLNTGSSFLFGGSGGASTAANAGSELGSLLSMI